MAVVTAVDLMILQRAGLEFLPEISVKGTAILLAAGVIAGFWRHSSAAQGHLVWAVAFANLLILPVLSLRGPRLPIPTELFTRASLVQAAPVTSSPESVVLLGSGLQIAAEVKSPPASDLPWKQTVVILWAGGVLVLLTLLLITIFRVLLMVRRGRALGSGPCVEAAAALSRTLGMSRPPKLIEAAGVDTMPLAWGLFRPVVLLPRGAADWPQARLEAVLLHELAHIRRRDILTQLLSQVAGALYWYNPLVWVGLRRLRLAGEQACDDVVIGAGIRASTYAEDLVTFARLIRRQRRRILAAASMAEPSQLPSRVRALLEEARNRRGVSTRLFALSSVLGLALSVAIGAATPASGAASVAAEGADPAPLGQALGASDGAGRRISETTVREAIMRYNPGVFARGISDNRYMWFLIGPEGDVRRSGIVQKRDTDGFSSADVVAEPAERTPATGYQVLQLSFLPGAGPRGETFAWIVAKDRQQR